MPVKFIDYRESAAYLMPNYKHMKSSNIFFSWLEFVQLSDTIVGGVKYSVEK